VNSASWIDGTELVDGVIIDIEPVSHWHANIGDILSRIFNEGARGRFRVREDRLQAALSAIKSGTGRSN
jgi:hypothetical protein